MNFDHNRLTDRQTDRQLSIIIPVYNVSDYLCECLDSCLAQDLDDYEIICVDDGSKDNSGAILDEYAQKHSNILVFHKENGGVSSARNYGIQKAGGKWIWFVDADDFIAENCCKYIFETAEKENPDVVLFDYVRTYNFVKELFSADRADVSVYVSKKDVMAMTPRKNYGSGTFPYWFLREKILKNNVLFDSTMKYSEDTKFVFQYRFNCERGLVVDFPVYYYRQREGSAMHNVNGQAHAYSMKQLAVMYSEYVGLCDGDKELENKLHVAQCRAIRSALFDYCFYVRNYELAKAEINAMQEKGLYPYKCRMGIYSKSIKGICINLLNECLRYKWIYLLMCRIMSLRG